MFTIIYVTFALLLLNVYMPILMLMKNKIMTISTNPVYFKRKQLKKEVGKFCGFFLLWEDLLDIYFCSHYFEEINRRWYENELTVES